MSLYRRDSMFRAFKLQQMFESGEVTVKMVSKKFGIPLKDARAWIDCASMFLPVIEKRKEQLPGWAKPIVIYGLMRE